MFSGVDKTMELLNLPPGQVNWTLFDKKECQNKYAIAYLTYYEIYMYIYIYVYVYPGWLAVVHF